MTISAFSRFAGIMFVGSMISADRAVGGNGVSYGKIKSLYTMSLTFATLVMVAFATVVVAGTRKTNAPASAPASSSAYIARSVCSVIERESYDENIM